MPMFAEDARNVFRKVEALGGTVPPELKRLVDLESRTRTIAPPKPTPRLEDAADLSDAELEALLNDTAAMIKLEEARSGLVQQFQVQIPVAIGAALKGSVGDALFKSLQKVVKKHVEALARVADILPEEVTAEQVLALGDKAAAAWREGPEHARALDDILWQVIRPIAYDAITENLQYVDHGLGRYVIFFADLSTSPDPDHLANRYTRGRDTNSRFSGWRTLQSVTAIHLNTPSEVSAYLATVHEAKRAALTPAALPTHAVWKKRGR